MLKYLLYLLFGKVDKVSDIVAPLQKTLANLEQAAKQRAQEIVKNNQLIADLEIKNITHKAEIDHSDRITEKLTDLLK